MRLRAARLGVLAIVLALVLLAPAVAARPAPRQAGTPSRPLDRDLEDYIVFGFTSVNIKGGTQNDPKDQRGIFSGGSVGTNGRMNICQARDVTLDDGTQLVADDLFATNKCHVWDVFANKVGGNPPIVPFHSGPTKFTGGVITAPTLPDIPCDASKPITVTDKTTPSPFPLPPGTYGDASFQNGTRVTLSAGLYTMCSLHTGQNVVVTTAVGTELRVRKDVDIRDATVFGDRSTCAVPVTVAGIGVKQNDRTISFGQNVDIFGHFLAPTGLFNLGHTSNLVGAFWANEIADDFNVNVTGCPARLGEFPITKSITGSGAGSQGPIQIDISCTGNGPIPPFTIPAGATGVVVTIVTGITVPAKCTVTEVATGDNEVIDVSTIGGGSGIVTGGARAFEEGPSADVAVCPVATPRVGAARLHSTPDRGANFQNIVETATTSMGSTSSTSTTQPTTTTTGGSTTTGESTTTSAESTTTTAASTTTSESTTTTIATGTTAGSTTTAGSPTTGATTTGVSTTGAVTTGATTTGATTTAAIVGTTTTIDAGTIPPDCTVPPTVSPTEVLPATGTNSVSPLALAALMLGALGAILLVATTVRRPEDV